MTKDPAKPCGFQFCNPIDCSGHGECKADQMKCVCDAGWSGEGCGVSLCPNSVMVVVSVNRSLGAKKVV